MTMITRLGYCPNCDKAHRPKTNQLFIVFGATSKTWQGMVALRSALSGFTPHIYEFQRLSPDCKTVYFSKLCSMVGCGTVLSEENGETFVNTIDEKWEDVYMSLKSWNKLCCFKDTGFKI